MKTHSIILFLFFFSCHYKGGLEEETQTLELTYVAWGCECANWTTLENLRHYHDEGDSLAERCVFLEPESSILTLPDTLGFNQDLIRFTGKFYKNKGYPEDFYSYQNVDKMRVFRYTAYEVLKSSYSEGRLND